MTEAGPAPETHSNGACHDHPRGERRRRYGRRRGGPTVGDAFVARLGPNGDERFASLDDPDEGPHRPRPRPGDSIDHLRFVALDCETTGQLRHQVVELGAVAFTLQGRLESLETLVHTYDRINPYARRIHGISSETLGGAPAIVDVVERFRRFSQGAVLVEHSADAFDTRLLARAMGRPLDADNIDTSRLAARLWGLRDTIGLERLCDELDVQHRRPHHALADAEATADCFVALVRQGREQLGWQTLSDLLADGQPPQRFDRSDGTAAEATRRRRRSRSSSRRRRELVPD